MSEWEKKEKEGTLHIDGNAQIIRKGSVLWKKATPNDTKDEMRYLSIIESENNKGEKKLELAMSVGLIFVNNNKIDKDSPDISGGVTIDGERYKFYGRKRESNKDGTPFTAFQLVKVEESVANENDDPLPF
tara:strand:- start:54 stop:446 length:393 start_codon:yes stop_codon:yes gene_type:complete